MEIQNHPHVHTSQILYYINDFPTFQLIFSKSFKIILLKKYPPGFCAVTVLMQMFALWYLRVYITELFKPPHVVMFRNCVNLLHYYLFIFCRVFKPNLLPLISYRRKMNISNRLTSIHLLTTIIGIYNEQMSYVCVVGS